jgi:hypothetical protein
MNDASELLGAASAVRDSPAPPIERLWQRLDHDDESLTFAEVTLRAVP